MDPIAAAITMVLTGAVMGWCLRVERRAPVIQGDEVVLQYATWMRWFLRGVAIAVFALVCFVTARLFAADATDRDARLAGLSALLLPLCVGGMCEPRVRLVLDAERVRGRTAFRGHREIAWSDVVHVTYSERSANWVLRARGGEKLRIPRYLVGSESLVTALEAKVPKHAWKGAVATWRRHRND